jgi:predicted Ser/Thr protein kinase
MADDRHESSAHERRVDEAIAAYLEAERAGRAPDPADWLARHPDLADELRSFLADREHFARLARPPAGGSATLAPASSSPTVTVRYFGDYELLEEIARGGMGVVYKARQVSLNRPVALKMILAGQLASPEDVRRFRAEAEAAANLRHPNIVGIHEVGEHQGQHYFSMDYVEGRSLAELLRDGPLPADRAARYVRTVAEAIHHAHKQGTLHRDLKPSNVLIDADDRPLVTDFGLAKKIEGGAGPTAPGQILGTPSFMPPEQAAGRPLGPAADVYSLGALLYALVTGRPPFQSDNTLDTLLQVLHNEPVPPRLLNPKIPADLETVCLKCLEKEPARRYGSAQELADDLGRFLAGEPVRARPPTLPFALRAWVRQNLRPTLWTVLVGFAAGLISWAPLELWGNQHPNDWTLFLAVMPLVVCMFGQGVVASLLVRPANRAGDVAVGAASGLVFGLTLFVLVTGPAAGQECVIRATEGDIFRLAEASQGGPDPSAALVKAYPQLRDVEPFRRGRWLFGKIENDLRTGLFKALWVGLLAALFPLPISIGTALATGVIGRYAKRRAAGSSGEFPFSRAEPGCLVALILAPVFAAPLGWTLLSTGVGAFWRSFAFLAWTGGISFLASRHRALYREALWRRQGLLSAALVACWLLAVARLWPEADAALPWYVDASAYAVGLALTVRYAARGQTGTGEPGRG